MSSHSAFAEAADALAVSVLGALSGTGGAAQLARYVDDAPDTLAALAAVRVLGADVFSPHLLAGHPFQAQDAAVVAKAFDAFPASEATEEAAVAHRDHATAVLLARLSGDDTLRAVAPAPADDPALSRTADWSGWSVRMAQLAPLATLGLDGPVHEAARAGALPLSRGVSRSILRRDFPTALRLVRWLAWLSHEGAGLPLDPDLAAEHVWLVGGAGPRAALDLAIARHFLAPQPGAAAEEAAST
ncbi:hypothetical protein [Streptomyces sp. HB132]|uniref:hypothetical protein n=1 Tax=Streptomyces sp. HB132 TaxID=767388 RepID=UPI001961D5AB|nr:hypothetical protein [Streptomyces sp. HB132]MBM7439946.1 hypothetical protein [Streptomyces sp. HB132]